MRVAKEHLGGEVPAHVRRVVILGGKVALAALGVAITIYAPSAQPPDTGDWLTAMQVNVAALETYVAERSP